MSRNKDKNILVETDPEPERTLKRKLREAKAQLSVENLTEIFEKEEDTAENNNNASRMLGDFTAPNSNLHGRSISIPAIGANNFELKPQLVSLMQQNCKFHGLPSEDPFQFLTEFLQICDTVKTNRVDPEVYRLMLFPFAVRDRARVWLDSQPKDSLNSWDKLVTAFLAKFFLPQKLSKLRVDVQTFRQKEETVSYPPSSLFSVLSRHSLLCSLVALTSRLRSLAHFSLGLARALTISDSSSSLWFVSSPCRTQSPPSLRSLRRWQKKTEPASCPSGGGRLRLLVSAINSVGQLSSPSIPGVFIWTTRNCGVLASERWYQQAEEYAALIMEELDPEETGFIMRLEVMEFSGLKSSSCVTHAINARDSSFFDVVASQLTPKVAINGFGCIGRNFLRCWHGRKDSPLDVVVVNDSGGVKNASHLLKYDSMLGTFKADVKIVDDQTIFVDGKPIKVVSNRDPLKLPWAELGVDIVIEGTGAFVDGPGAGKHIQAGAKKVIITAPAKGIVKGTMTTTHSYTGDQRLLDASHRDLRRARAAALNIVPTSTGAAKAVSLVLPKLKGKLNGIALRVPTPNVSVVDLVINVEKKGVTAEEVNAAFRKAAEGPLKGVLDVCDVPLVSVDFRCTDVSSTIDSSLIMVMGDDMVKVVAWYDNEWGYSQRVVDLAHLVANKWPGVAAAKGGGDPLEEFMRQTQLMKNAKSLNRIAALVIIAATRPYILNLC
ncbi:Glyceraldehyde-3-phosphate dehydrogenase B [Arachis hypogaea]|nr:Glyceraldehyde-3-phosphate dehydrogenase B [Arachis hypogaea]